MHCSAWHGIASQLQAKTFDLQAAEVRYVQPVQWRRGRGLVSVRHGAIDGFYQAGVGGCV